MAEDWTGMITWMKEHHPRLLGFIWNSYMRYERKHDSEYYHKE
jgi:hypothetical protein